MFQWNFSKPALAVYRLPIRIYPNFYATPSKGTYYVKTMRSVIPGFWGFPRWIVSDVQAYVWLAWLDTVLPLPIHACAVGMWSCNLCASLSATLYACMVEKSLCQNRHLVSAWQYCSSCTRALKSQGSWYSGSSISSFGMSWLQQRPSKHTSAKPWLCPSPCSMPRR